jgi:hypothetical protein
LLGAGDERGIAEKPSDFLRRRHTAVGMITILSAWFRVRLETTA